MFADQLHFLWKRLKFLSGAIMTLVLGVVVLGALTAFAQNVIVPPAPSILDTLKANFLSPAGLGGLLATVAAIIGSISWFNQKRKKLIALAAFYAFHIIEDIGLEKEGNDAFDKAAAALKKLDEYMVANGWRALKPGEVEVAKMQLQALHGAEVAKAKVAEAAAAASPS